MTFNISWFNGVNLHVIVLESHAALPIDFYSGYVLDHIPSIKGVRVQEGSQCTAVYILVSCPGAPLVWSPFPDGFSLPSLVPSPLSGLKMNLLLFQPARTITDEVVWAVTVITVFLCLFSIFHCPGKAYDELFSYTFGAIQVLIINASLLVGSLSFEVLWSADCS